MSRTVDTTSTFEDWRQKYNDLADDVGGLNDLRTGVKSTVVDAVNYIQDQYFYFQDFDFDGSDGASSNTVFSGTDNAGVAFTYAPNKVLVYKNGVLLRKGSDYVGTNGTSITLGSSAANSDVIRVSSFTGSYEGVSAAQDAVPQNWHLAGDVLFNDNDGGIIFNADSTANTSLETANSFQFEDITFFKETVTMKSVANSPTELRFGDNDNSHYVALKAPSTISSNVVLTLPPGDGANAQHLVTNGSGVLTFIDVHAKTVEVTANNATNETVYLTFVDGATGAQGVESDTGLTWNPYSNILTANFLQGTAAISNAVLVTQTAADAEYRLVFTETNDATDASGQIYKDTSASLLYNPATNKLTATIADDLITATQLNVSGNGTNGQVLKTDGDGSFTWINLTTTAEIEDIAGGLFSNNTETGITATYQASDNTLDLVIGDNKIVGSMIADDQVTLAKMAGIARGRIIYGDASGNPAYLALGSDGSVLKSDGNDVVWGADAGLTLESVQDIVGNMVSGTGNTETGITVTYNDLGDGAGKLSFVIGDDQIVGSMIDDDTINSEHYAAGSIDNEHMSANSINSDQYVDGSIDTDHIADDQVTLAKMAGIDRGKIIYGDSSGNPAVLALGTSGQVLKSDGSDVVWGTDANSSTLTTEQVQDIVGGMVSGTGNTETGITVTYNDLGVDVGKLSFVIGDDDIVQSMMAVNSVDSDQYVDDSIDTAHIADNQVTLAKMAGIARGKIIYGDSSGNPAVLAPGTNGQVLKSDGTDISWGTDASGGGADGNTTYSTSWVDSNTNAILRLTPSSGSADDLTIVAGTNIELTPSGDNLTIDCALTTGDGGLTTKNFTAALKTKLDGIEASADVNQNAFSSFPIYNAGPTHVGTAVADSTGDSFTIFAGGNITLASSGDNITITAANTTYSAGAGLDLSGTTFAIEDDVREHANQRFGNNSLDFVLFDGGNELIRFYVGDSEMVQIDAAGNLDVENDVIAFSSSVSSDERLKKNIKRIESPLDTVMKLEGVTFDWKKDDRNSMGLIAQEVEKYLPYLVTESKSLNSDEMSKKLNYNGLIGLLLESIKELKTEIDDLKSSKT